MKMKQNKHLHLQIFSTSGPLMGLNKDASERHQMVRLKKKFLLITKARYSNVLKNSHK